MDALDAPIAQGDVSREHAPVQLGQAGIVRARRLLLLGGRMYSLTLALALAATACISSARPIVESRSSVAITGAEFKLTGRWSSTCTRHSGSLKSGYDYETGCGFKPIRVEVQCTACEIVGPAVQEVKEDYEVRLVSMQPGPLAIRIVMTRLDTGEQHVEERTVDVVKPDWLGFLCLDHGSPGYCRSAKLDLAPPGGADEARVLDASAPRIFPQVGLIAGMSSTESRLVRVNGRPVSADTKRVGFSLADVFPEARVGDGIAPGIYRIELAVYDRVKHYTVLAR